jgi:AraC family transcriptional regulator, regulatory protein of adaptative response / methylated-DNA-[protein]-cysteine methyltransferase
LLVVQPFPEITRKIRIDRRGAEDQNGTVNSDMMWQRVLEHDPGADGQFVYGVASTGIYCRPSCTSRRPLRRHVRFFDGPADAERAGFRACRRCGGTPAQMSAAALVERACRVVARAEPGRQPTLSELAARLRVSPSQLHRAFRATLGISPKQYADALRAGRLKTLLKHDQPATAALYEAGYGSSSRLYERTNAELGMTPDAYRRGGLGMHIHFVVVRSTLGYLLVGATERGICSIKLGDAAKPLEEDLRREYPKATVSRDLGKLSPAVVGLVEFVAGQRPPSDLPLDVQGTAFQRRVWACLQRIPLGRTKSYGEVAQAIGQPGSARAVARACASNHAALVIPCHRVVAGDGTTGGYHWGQVRKERLLAIERELASSAATRPRAGRVPRTA